jgi:hypothetical protein
MASDNRRHFLGKMAALAALPVAGRAAPRLSPPGARPEQALHLREAAAVFQSRQAQASHPTNGDESSLPNYIGNFCKGLPHTQLGEVETSAYQSLLEALAAGTQTAIEGIERGSGAKLVDPLAGLAFQMEGEDSHCLGVPAPPAFASAAAADEMVELYWQALARDVPFTDYGTNPITAAAAQDLSKLSAFQGPTSGGQVTTGTLFRGSYTGGLNGPFVSQFFWQPVPLNSTYTPLRRTGACAALPGPLYPSRRHLQSPSHLRCRRQGHLPVEGLRSRRQATQDDGYRRRVPAPLHAPCPAARVRPDSLFRLSRESAPATASAPL